MPNPLFDPDSPQSQTSGRKEPENDGIDEAMRAESEEQYEEEPTYEDEMRSAESEEILRAGMVTDDDPYSQLKTSGTYDGEEIDEIAYRKAAEKNIPPELRGKPRRGRPPKGQEKNQPPPQVVVNVGEQRRGPGRPPKSMIPEERPSNIKPEFIDLAKFDDIISSFGLGDQDAFVTLYRLEPKSHLGRSIHGYLERYDSQVTLQDIKDMHGGGKFKLCMYGPRVAKDGSRLPRLVRNLTFNIGGLPKTSKKRDDDYSSQPADDPGLAKVVLNQSQEILRSIQEEKQKETDKADKFMQMALTNRGDNGQTQHIMGLMKEILTNQTKNLELQLQAAREDSRKKDDQLMDMERRHRDDVNNITKEIRQESERSTSPIMVLMQQQSTDAQKRMELMFEIQKSSMQSTLDMVRENANNQMKMLLDSNNMQVTLLRGELERLSKELSEQRTANRGDLAGEIKKYRTMKELFSREGDEGPQSTVGAIVESLPVLASMIPGIRNGAQALFGKGTPVPVQRPIPVARALPPANQAPPAPKMHRIVRPPVQPQPAARPPQTKIDHAKVALGIGQANSMIEQAISNNVTPEKFVESFNGNLDQSVLKEIASANTDVLVQFIQSKAGDDSVLHTAKGEGFLKKMHQLLKAKHGA